MSSLNPIRDILEFGGDGFELRSSFARFRLKIVVAFKCTKNGKLNIQVKLTKAADDWDLPLRHCWSRRKKRGWSMRWWEIGLIVGIGTVCIEINRRALGVP